LEHLIFSGVVVDDGYDFVVDDDNDFVVVVVVVVVSGGGADAGGFGFYFSCGCYS
jgi:hypothetical protein